MRCIQTAAVALALFAPALCFAAGGKAVLESGEAEDKVQSSVEYDGKGALRMEVAGEASNYMIFRDGKPYGVTLQDGHPIVMDLGAMMKAMGGMMQGPQQQQALPGASEIAELRELRNTGRTETVAGVSGEVYELIYVDTQGKTQTDTLVLSKDAKAHELTKAMFAMSQSMATSIGHAEPAGTKKLESEIIGGKKGILRFGAQFRVISLSDAAPVSSRFELPAAPMQLPNMSDLMEGLRGQ